jgi:RNA-binding protein
MDLSEKQLRFLRGRGHPLKPVVLIGKTGLTAAVIAETQRALEDHELIKVRVRAGSRDERDAMLAELVGATKSALVSRIGHVGLLYRERSALPRLVLPA